LYGLGVRSLGITYSESNMLGTGMADNDLGGGLTDFGYDCVKRMNKLGMLIDIAHCAEQTCLDTIEASYKPIYNSHSGPASIARGHVNEDETLLALAEKDGLLGVGGAGRGLSTLKNPIGSIDSYMECVEYCIELMGIDHVGCGPDTMYGDHQGLYHAMGERRRREGFGHFIRPTKPPRPRRFEFDPSDDPGYVRGLENPSDFHNIPRWLVKNGYSDEEIIKIIGGNGLRLLKAVL